MSLALVRSRALQGLQARPVRVEVHLANGLPSFTLVGLADTEVKEARERVRSAIANAGLSFPSNKRITVNLAPADLPKDSGRFDLPIALGILAASDQIAAAKLEGWEFAGELSLSGELRPIRGALAMSLALHQQQLQHTADRTKDNADNACEPGSPVRLVLPPESAAEAALVPDAHIYRARHLLDAVAPFLHTPQDATDGPCDDQPQVSASADGWGRLSTPSNLGNQTRYPDLADVKGQAAARRALEVAAAGGHSLLMVGPPGSGKSMLAHRFAGLLPPMDTTEALESAAVASLAGRFDLECWGQRPTSAPHHSASAVALVGGGSPPRPGEISLAHHGVLFLDEMPEFPRVALEALREPLETGQIRISRAAFQSEFPAKFQLIAAMNPCPCGYLGHPRRACRCSPEQVARYQGKLSGPLLDRIDLHVEVPALPPEELLEREAPASESSDDVRSRVLAARERADARQGKPNQSLSGRELDQAAAIDDSAIAFLNKAATRMGWSARSTHRSLRVARTIADLAGCTQVSAEHVAEAIQYRRALKQAH
ncbi:YifB family Mg chelatase-like AAA ATPase [Hydrogenophaga sp. 5NK40-0174]|uniref:YifB family Mg chelatase-like AAA ATPase n=1 Tax=Hydrogenophaga sp. 5NK40-0174 TaxID=3127649 RepID=UPI00310B6BE7